MPIINVNISPLLNFSPGHSHNVWEIVLNLQGEGHMLIGKKEYSYGPGTIICQPPNIPHVKYCKGQFRDIHIQPSIFALSTAGLCETIVLQDDSEKSVETLLLMINRIYHRKEKEYMEIIKSLYEAMEQFLINWYRYTPESAEIEKLKNKLANQFTDPEFSIRGLLSEGGYCIDHLRRLFKQSAGLTPLEYLIELRLNYAKKLMRENDKLHYTIAEISTMSGFYDTDYFSRIFKKKTKKTPSEYLNSCAEREK